MSEIILHVGLPKTATSLLQQHVFNQLDNKVDYLGVFQPREEVLQDALYSEIYDLTICSNSDFLSRLHKAREALDLRLKSSNLPLLISEEVFCVDSNSIPWQEKFNRLGQLIKGYESTVLVTIREPISAIFSYYVEIYHDVKSTFPKPMDFALNSNYAKIYDYNHLNSIIKDSFFNVEVSYVSFDLLKTGAFVPRIFNVLEVQDKGDFYLPNTNAKIKSNDWVKSHKKNIYKYFCFLLKIPVLSSVLRIPFLKAILKKPSELLKKTNIPMTETKIKVFSTHERTILEKKYKESKSFFSSIDEA